MKISPLFLLAVVCFVFTNLEITFAQQTSAGSITQLIGEVKLTRDGKVNDALVNEDIRLNDIIETGEDSFAKIVFKDHTSIEIASDTNLEVNKFIYNPSERKSKFSVLKGSIKSEIKKIENTESSVEFQTRNAVAGVKGTVLYINADDDFFGCRVGRIYVRGLPAGSKTVYVSSGYYTTLVNGIPVVPRVMTQAMLRQFDDIFDYRRYLPSEANEVIRKSPFNLKKPKFFK
jgi:hypothetical protein